MADEIIHDTGKDYKPSIPAWAYEFEPFVCCKKKLIEFRSRTRTLAAAGMADKVCS